MDKRVVGNNAGKVWCALKEIGEISIPELARRLNLSVESTALAAGWLARENKICIQRKKMCIRDRIMAMRKMSGTVQSIMNLYSRKHAMDGVRIDLKMAELRCV